MPNIEENAVLVVLNDESSVSASVVPSESEEGILEGMTAWKPVLAGMGYVSDFAAWTIISSMLSHSSEASFFLLRILDSISMPTETPRRNIKPMKR
jgi:hypothetical protein